MDIAELIAETEELKKRSIETAQQLAEAKKLLSKILWNVPYFKAQLPGNLILDAIGKDIEEFLQ